MTVLCADCWRDLTDVKKLDPPTHMFLCDDYAELDQTGRAFRLSRDPAESDRLYHRLVQLRQAIEAKARQ